MKNSVNKSSSKMALLAVAIAMIISLISLTSCSIEDIIGGDSKDDMSGDVTPTAKWQFDFDADDTVLNETATFNLLENVSSGDFVAPGSKGSFKLVGENVSEKNAICTVSLKDNRTDDFLIRYSYDNEVWFDSTEDINEFLANKTVEAGKSIEYIIYWEWAFDDNNTDTSLGAVAAPNLKVTADITVSAAD